VAGDYAAGAPAALGGRRVVPPLLLDIPGRVYERPADAATSERSRWGAASARCSEATPCVPAHLVKAGHDRWHAWHSLKYLSAAVAAGLIQEGIACAGHLWPGVQVALSARMQRVQRHGVSGNSRVVILSQVFSNRSGSGRTGALQNWHRAAS